MKFIRKLIPILAGLLGLWVMGSFVGVMFNLSNADFWTTSLMWSLLASLLVMPALVMVYHATGTPRKAASDQEGRKGASSPTIQRQPPFVSEEEEEGVLWSEGEKNRSTQE
jgi:hypothetical protein